MATLTPTLTLASTDISANETLNLSVTDSLSILGQSYSFQHVTSGTSTIFLANGGWSDRTYVFLHNLSTTSAEIITIELDSGDHAFAKLGAGEFAFFPWDTSQDLRSDSASGTPTLEVRVYQAAAA
tara:strand:- start:689 stop:1066 length:378 start_codon:yes stop_codon:yes gene_type:complete